MADLLAWDGTKLAPVPGVTVAGGGPCFMVWDERAREHRCVPVVEAARDVLRHARTLRPGEPARAEAERQALAMLQAAGLSPPGKRKQDSRG